MEEKEKEEKEKEEKEGQMKKCTLDPIMRMILTRSPASQNWL